MMKYSLNQAIEIRINVVPALFIVKYCQSTVVQNYYFILVIVP